MSSASWLALGALAIVVVATIVRSASRRAEAQLSGVRQEMQNSLAAHSHAVAAQISQQISHLTQAVTQQLGQVRQELQNGVASTGQLASQGQREAAEPLKAATALVAQMRQRRQNTAEGQQASQDLSKAAQTLQSVLGGAKTRGALGEVTLDRMLGDALPQSAYAVQYR